MAFLSHACCSNIEEKKPNIGKAPKTPEEKAQHAAWMRMSRSIRSSLACEDVCFINFVIMGMHILYIYIYLYSYTLI